MVSEVDAAGFATECYEAVADVPSADWDACCGPGDPLLAHRHLLVLEECGLATPATGFAPRLLLLRDREGRAVGAAPAYLKTNSAGELGVDLGLPLAHARAVGPYYPKVQVEVPMDPTPGPRLVVRPTADGARGPDRVRGALLVALRRLAEAEGASSVQLAHGTAADQAAAVAAGFAASEGNTFAWRSRGEASFADVVASMHAGGRRRVRRDRKEAAATGLRFERRRGAALTPGAAARMSGLYAETFRRFGSAPRLTPAYFEAAFARMPDAIDLLVARAGDDWAAAMMSVGGGEALHVQHWGSAERGGAVLFEMYYRQLEDAIAGGYRAVDFGPAGGHKCLRGIGIEPARHALWFRDGRFQEVAAAACARRRAAAAAEREAEAAKLPWAARAEAAA